MAVRIYNLAGERLSALAIDARGSARWYVPSTAAGVYLFLVVADGSIAARGTVAVRR